MLYQYLPYRKMTQLYAYRHYIFIFFSTMVYHGVLKIGPCALW